MSNETVASRMRISAGKFRKAAKGEENRIIAATLLKVARDYIQAAQYIEDLERKLMRYQLQAVRNTESAA